MNKLALVFAGQGSQYKGMGLDFIEADSAFKEHERNASNILGFDVKEVLASDDSRLNETKFAQPLILFSTILGYEAFKSLEVEPKALLGFSLGEYSALYAANVFGFEDIMKIISKRSSLMQECAIKNPGKMAAILGLSSKVVDDICKVSSRDGIVLSANYNSPIQVVISGENGPVIKAMELAKEMGAKRVVELNVSGAFHSPLMNQAAEELYKFIKNIPYNEPKYPIYMNTTAMPLESKNLYHEMKKQIESSVYFEQSIQKMIEDGFTHFIEIGPGKVLSGLIKKININCEVTNLDKYSDLNNLKGWLSEHGFKK
ncbi:MAG: ACP S-malonyltransferase [Acholeplasmataceae bacterium]|nr:ACP S-malonyltransferase [Acholeplasmataceae bacterium]